MRRYVTLFLLATAAAGCDVVGPQEIAPPEPILPLAVGNTWVYTTVSYDYEGAPRDTVTRLEGVFADSTVDGETWYAWGKGETSDEAEADAFHHTRSRLWYTLRDDGLWRGPPGSATPWHEIPYPASVGETNRPRLIDGRTVGGGNMTLVSTDTTVTVAAGTFRCYHYQEQGVYTPYHANDRFYAPGVGRVLSVNREYFRGEVYVRSRSELTSYRVSE